MSFFTNYFNKNSIYKKSELVFVKGILSFWFKMKLSVFEDRFSKNNLCKRIIKINKVCLHEPFLFFILQLSIARIKKKPYKTYFKFSFEIQTISVIFKNVFLIMRKHRTLFISFMPEKREKEISVNDDRKKPIMYRSFFLDTVYFTQTHEAIISDSIR